MARVRVNEARARKELGIPVSRRIFDWRGRYDFQDRIRAKAAVMPVQAARTLNGEVDGSEICHHRVEIEIERLLDDLRRNDNPSKPLGSAQRWRARLAETVDNFPLDGRPV